MRTNLNSIDISNTKGFHWQFIDDLPKIEEGKKLVYFSCETRGIFF